MAQHGQEFIQYAPIASADSCSPLMMLHELIYSLAI